MKDRFIVVKVTSVLMLRYSTVFIIERRRWCSVFERRSVSLLLVHIDQVICVIMFCTVMMMVIIDVSCDR